MKAAIFDMDGTLLDTNEAWNNFIPDSLRNHGIASVESVSAELQYMTFDKAAVYIQKKYLPDIPLNTLYAEWNHAIELYFKYSAPTRKGVPALLAKLKADHVRMCIATMTDERFVSMALQRLSLLDYFEFIYPNADKRTPHVFLECAARLGATPSECTVYEDSAYAAKTAKESGFQTIGVRCPFTYTPEFETYCDIFVNSIEDLL